MKKGINIWSFPEGTDIAEAMVTAVDAGFEGIELALNETGPLSLESKTDEIRSYRRMAEDKGLELTSLASGLYWSYPMTSASAATRAKSSDIVKKQLEFAAELGVDTILVVPGAVGVDFIPDAEVVPYDKAYDNALEGFSALAAEAEAHQVSIGLENVWNKFLLSPLELRDFIDKIGSDYVGSYLDIGNVVYSGYPEHWVRILGSRIKRVHLKDYRREAGGLSGFVDLLAGDVNYPEVMRALREVGYDNYVTAEMIPPYKHHAKQIIYNTSGAIDAILERVKR